MLRKLVREPLAHFLVLGAVIFAIFHSSADRGDVREGKIVVTRGTLDHLVAGFSRTWQRPPSRQELDGLVEDHIREEVLYREALAIGLDKDDTIVRRRLRQKLEFLTGDASAIVAPADHDLQSWLDRNQDKFRVEPAVAFSQIYFNPARHGEAALIAASEALSQLRRTEEHPAFTELGDATLLPSEMPLSSAADVGHVFGHDFARLVTQLPPGRWTGPLQSGYGLHLVRVSERTAGGSRPLAEVREAVQREWYAARSKEIIDLTYGKLRGKYSIRIDDYPHPRAAAELPSSDIADVTQRP